MDLNSCNPKIVNNPTFSEPGYLIDDENETDLTSFPDIDEFLDKVVVILEKMVTGDMIELKKNNHSEYVMNMEKEFPEFSVRYYSLFMKIISGDDITPLMSMLYAIDQVKKGNLSLEDAEKQVGNDLACKYIYPNFKP